MGDVSLRSNLNVRGDSLLRGHFTPLHPHFCHWIASLVAGRLTCLNSCDWLNVRFLVCVAASFPVILSLASLLLVFLLCACLCPSILLAFFFIDTRVQSTSLLSCFLNYLLSRSLLACLGFISTGILAICMIAFLLP